MCDSLDLPNFNSASMNTSLATTVDISTDFFPWNDPSNIVSFQAYLGTLYYYNVVMKPVVTCAGVGVNIVNCLVFKRQGLRDRVNLCLFTLALVEIVYLIYCMTFVVAFWIRILEPVLGEEVYQKIHSYAGGVCNGFREATACISIVIAVERCVCVVFPLRANSLMTTRTMARLLVAIVISMQLAFLATPIKRYVHPVYDNSTGGIRWAVDRAAAWQNSETLLLYDTIDDTLMLIVFPFITVILVSGSTVITVVKLRAAMSWREKTSSIKGDTPVRQVALTKMLVLASCIFIASKIPFVSFTVARVVNPEFSLFGNQYNAFRIAELLVYYFPYSYCSVSFFVYYSMSARFRAEVKRLCGCLRVPSELWSREMTDVAAVKTNIRANPSKSVHELS